MSIAVKIVNALLVLFSLFLAILGTEIFLNYFHNYNGPGIYRSGDKIVDERDTRFVLLELLSKGIEAYPAVPPHVYKQEAIDKNEEGALVPLGGISRTTTAFCNELYKYVIYQSDRFGFSNDDRLWDASRPVMLIGGSFVHGACVPPDKTIGAHITRLGKPTLSVGMNGNGPLLDLASLVEYGPAVKAPVVVWVFGEGNGMNFLAEEMRYPAIRRYLNPEFRQDLMHRQPEIDKVLKAFVNAQTDYQNIKASAKTYGSFHTITRFRNTRAVTLKAYRAWRDGTLTARRQPEQLAMPNDYRDGDLADLSTMVGRAKILVGSWGGRLYFVYMPQWARFKYPGSVGSKKEDVINVVSAHRIPIIDLGIPIGVAKDPLQLYAMPDRGGHLTEEGYNMISQFIFDRIVAETPN